MTLFDDYGHRPDPDSPRCPDEWIPAGPFILWPRSRICVTCGVQIIFAAEMDDAA